MILTVLVGAASFIAGAGTAWAALYLRTLRNVGPVEVVDGLTDADRAEVTRDFAVHVHSVQRKVSEFADALADGDEDLRDRLRHFENGGGRS